MFLHWDTSCAADDNLLGENMHAVNRNAKVWFVAAIPFMKNLRRDQSWGMLAVIRVRIFCLPVCYSKIYRLIYRELKLFLLFVRV